MKKILVGIDGSEGSLKAVDFVGRHFSGILGLHITLLHVLPYLPTSFWDDGHILTTNEKDARKQVVDVWVRNQQTRLEPIFQTAMDLLIKRGVDAAQIETKGISDSTDVADSIIEEARDGRYETVVLGRRGLAPAKRALIGSVTAKIVNHAAGVAVCIVE